MRTIVIDTPEGIKFARLAVLRAMLRLELLGLHRRGRSAYALLKDMGYRGSRQKVLDVVNAEIEATLQALESRRDAHLNN